MLLIIIITLVTFLQYMLYNIILICNFNIKIIISYNQSLDLHELTTKNHDMDCGIL